MARTPEPARRATRASSRATSATPAPAQTPAPEAAARKRGRPSRKSLDPLPALPTATSYAYGAQGRVSLGTQLAAGRDAEFGLRFDIGREDAVDRDEDEEDDEGEDISEADEVTVNIGRSSRQASAAPSSIASHRTRRNIAFANGTIPEETIEEEPEGIRVRNNILDDSSSAIDMPSTGVRSSKAFSLTNLDSTFSYVGRSSVARTPARAPARPIARPAPRPPRVAAAVVPPATLQEVDAARPWSAALLWETLMRWTGTVSGPYLRLSPALKNLAALAILVSLLVLIFGRAPLNSAESGFRDLCHSVETGMVSMRNHVEQARVTAEQRSQTIDKDLYERVGRIESDLGTLRGQNVHFQESMSRLEQILPQQVFTEKNEASGKWTLPPSLWHALREKVVADPAFNPGQPAGGAAPLWDAFIANNRARIQDLVSNSAEEATDLALHKRVESGHIVSRDMFIQMIKENNARFEDQISKSLDTFEAAIGTSARSIAHNAAADLIKRHPSVHAGVSNLEALALANIARNNELAIKTMNYFSAPLGAVVDPYLTSPTHKRQQGNLLANVYTKMPWYKGYEPHGAVAALERWDEVTDCWCAAESDDKGKAQIGVIMPKSIEVKSITFEHIPAQGTYDIGAAPKEFEVWVFAFEATDSRTLQQCTQSPGKGYVCVGKAKYDVHASNHVQNFPLYHVNVGLVNKVVVKVINNWGQEWTCLYRIRMHGDNEGEVEHKRPRV